MINESRAWGGGCTGTTISRGDRLHSENGLFQKLGAPPTEDKHIFSWKFGNSQAWILSWKNGNSKTCKIHWEFPFFVQKTLEILGILMSSLPLQPQKWLIWGGGNSQWKIWANILGFPCLLLGYASNFWNSPVVFREKCVYSFLVNCSAF